MRPSIAAIVVGSWLLVLAPVASRAADVPYKVVVDGRMLDAHTTSARNRDGVVYINVVRAVRAFDGLLTFGRGGTVRVTIEGRTLNYRVGRSTALLDTNVSVPLRGVPYMSDGDIYVPIASIATLAMARYSIDTQHKRVTLYLGRSVGFAPPGTHAVPEPSTEDVGLSPLQALAFTPSATTDATGLHARVEIKNTTDKPYAINFPGPQQFAFVVVRNGTEIWTSQATKVSEGPSTFRLLPGETTTLKDDWPGFLRAGPGRFTLRIRMLKTIPIDTAPVSLGEITPGPSAGP